MNGNTGRSVCGLTAAASLVAALSASVGRATEATYLPDATASKVVTVTRGETAAAGIAVFTQAVAIKETGPKETVARFGEVYAFSPPFLAVHQD